MQKCPCGNSEFRRYLEVDDEGNATRLLGVGCLSCGQEWLREKYPNTEGERRLIFGELELRENITVRDEIQTAFQVRGSRTKIGHNDIHLLRKGDHITWHRPWIIWHHAVILEVNLHTRQVNVAHWTKVKGNYFNKIRICREWLKLDDQLGDLYRIDYPDDVTEKNPPNLVIARALSRLDETGYGLLKNNCEGFAAFCKTGVISESSQTHWFWAKISEIDATILIATTLIYVILYATYLVVKVVDKSAVGSVYSVEYVYRTTIQLSAAFTLAVEYALSKQDLCKMYENRKNGNMSRIDFIESVARRIMEAILSVGGCLLGVSMVAVLGGQSVNPNVADIGLYPCVGLFGSLIGKLVSPAIRPYVGKAIVYCIHRDDRAVAAVDDLDIGDQVVFHGWLLYPRHYAIVSDKDCVHNKLRIIHNTNKEGVVEEWVDFVQPLYKVIYPDGESYPSNDVIERGQSKLGCKEYSLITNNSKDFARWCKEI